MKALLFSTLLFSILLSIGQNQPASEPMLNPSEFAPKVDALVQQYLDLDIFSGVVLITEQGKPIYHKAFGMADRAKGRKNELQTPFDIGSMNKTMTELIILQLVQEKQLKLKDRLGKHLDGFPDYAADQITIEHLLNHSSGYGDYYMTPGYFERGMEDKTITKLVSLIQTMPLMFEPGTEQEYSNSGFILLGAIIEKVTGLSYHENVQKRIVEPLNLSHTFVKQDRRTVPNRAIGYYKNMKGELLTNEDFQEVANPDGGFHATAGDVAAFYREYHYGNTLVPEKGKRKSAFFRMTKEHSTSGAAIPIAGGWNGANSVHYEILRDNISIVVLANMDEPVAEQLGMGILNLIRKKQPESPALPAIQSVYQAYWKHGIAFVKANFESLTINFHPDDPRALVLNQIGYGFLKDKATDQAVEIFKLNTELFPDDPNVWDSLGEAYLEKGEKEQALQSYKKALTIDPEMPSAQAAVKKLKK